MKALTNVDILVIPDAHAHPSVSNDRFKWLGRFIVENQPEAIIDIGDWGDLVTISKYDKPPDITLDDEIKSIREANKQTFGAIQRFNNTHQRLRKKKFYKPTIIRTMGNHDDRRILEHIKTKPEDADKLRFRNLGYGLYGEEIVPFLKPRLFSGIAFCHYFYEKDQRYPISEAHALNAKKHMSCVAGHTHTRDYCEAVRADGVRIQSVIVGCYLDPEDKSPQAYAGPQGIARSWSGLVMLRDVNERGEFDVEFIGIERIKREYS